MMQCYASWLLGKEYRELQKADLIGIQAKPVSDNLLEWYAKVEGLKDTLWEGAVLQLTLRFSEAYNSVPPTVEFNTIPFHPNVDKDTGRPCISYLDSKHEWNSSISIISILLSIQRLLSNPVMEGVVNPEAAELLWTSPSTYHTVVMDCVRASQELERIGKAVQLESRKPRSVKFEEYLVAWTKMATTKAGSRMRNESLEDLVKRPEMFAMYYGSSGRESPMRPLREAFKAVMYGTASKPRKTEPVSERRQTRIDQMKKIYLLYKTPDRRTPQLCVQPQRDSPATRGLSRCQDHWEDEVDMLVAWTHSLSFEELEK